MALLGMFGGAKRVPPPQLQTALTTTGAGAVLPQAADSEPAIGSGFQYTERDVGGYKLRVAKDKLTTEASIAAAMTFARTLCKEINLAAGLYSHICPVEVVAGSRKVAILCSERMIDGAELPEVLRALARHKYALADGLAPNVFLCPVESLVLSVSKEHITGEDVAKRKKVLGAGGDGAPLWRNFTQVVGWAVQQQASDIHFNINDLSERSQIRFTIDGKYVAPESFSLPTKVMSQMVGVAYQLSKGGNGSEFQPLTEQQCRIFCEVPNGDKTERVMLRWASLATDDGPQITLRPLLLDAVQARDLATLGYLPSQIDRLQRSMVSEGGAVIVSGVLGSGKSTLLAAIMSSIPPTRKIVTLEDPREYIIVGAHQNTIQRSLETEDDKAFVGKVRTLKRTGVHELMIGEIRDRQTGQVFQDGAESGLNVYTTVHARRAIGIPDRLASPFIGIDRAVLATPGILKLLVAQVLLPVNCPRCAIPAKDVIAGRVDLPVRDAGGWGAYLERIKRLYDLDLKEVHLRNPCGCPQCQRPGLDELSGFMGRTVAAEMIEPTEEFLELVRDARNIELERYVSSLRRAAIDDPDDTGKSALEVALYHVSQGHIDPREVEPRFEAFETIELRRSLTGSRRLKAVA